jgi:hypothetical protein
MLRRTFDCIRAYQVAKLDRWCALAKTDASPEEAHVREEYIDVRSGSFPYLLDTALQHQMA